MARGLHGLLALALAALALLTLGVARQAEGQTVREAAPQGTPRHTRDPREWVLSPGYYWQAIAGHLRVLQAARPLDEWIDDPATPPALKPRLREAQAMRAFASDALALPRNASYTRYADLGRSAVVWNVVAAPADDLTLRAWCFPVAGCASYRGYYDEAEARAYAGSLGPGLDVLVYPVVAYSTLGWLNALGGDPLLSTMLAYPQGELARMLFHELAHQVAYAPDDTDFNEAYATAVERLGGEAWLQGQADEAVREAYAAFDARRRQMRALNLATRERLQRAYREAPSAAARLEAKAGVLAGYRQAYAELKAGWGGYAGYDHWVEQANNAWFAIQASYEEAVPAFERLFEREGRDFARFHAAVRALAALPADARRAALHALRPSPGPDADASVREAPETGAQPLVPKAPPPA